MKTLSLDVYEVSDGMANRVDTLLEVEMTPRELVQAIEEFKNKNENIRKITLPPPDEGYRWSDEREYPKKDQKYFVVSTMEVEQAKWDFSEGKHFTQIKIRRTYDWSKTGHFVHVKYPKAIGFFEFGSGPTPDRRDLELATHWQAHDGGKCPIDSCCIVTVRFRDGSEASHLCGSVNWCIVTSWKFIRLIDGVDWN
jgi:hypothetical protein